MLKNKLFFLLIFLSSTTSPVIALSANAPFSEENYKQELADCDKSHITVNQQNQYCKYDQRCENIRNRYGEYLIQKSKSLILKQSYPPTKKDYEAALFFSEEADTYDKSGMAASLVAAIYNMGFADKQDYYKAIYWYKKAIEKMESDSSLREYRGVVTNDMGVAYEGLRKYTDAFQCYYKAATMGEVVGQFDLAKMYYRGRGTIQDNMQAFAWVSVATAQGLRDKKSQDEAEQLKEALYLLLTRTNELSEASKLAKKYYSEYVLHGQPKQ